NTKKLIVAHVPTENGLPSVEGDYAIDGIPGTGARIRLDYYDPGGALTGRLLPTGRVRDTVHVDGVGPVEISLVDASNIGCFFHPRALGLTGTELPEQVDADPVLLARIESIRAQAAVLCGLAATAEEATLRSPANPKIAFVSPPTDYTTIKGSRVRAPDVDLVGRIMSMGKAHRAYALTGAIATSVAAAIEGTVANEVCRPGPAEREVRVGHPSGVIAIGAHVERRADGWHAVKVSNSRTARRLMEGHVYVPARILAAAAR
ncbi:MAG: hypothetical protein HY660_17530, partial [Armatimonadetes bacterium]|nr:hypothetical protein [Armatimonadota bacterium]